MVGIVSPSSSVVMLLILDFNMHATRGGGEGGGVHGDGGYDMGGGGGGGEGIHGPV